MDIYIASDQDWDYNITHGLYETLDSAQRASFFEKHDHKFEVDEDAFLPHTWSCKISMCTAMIEKFEVQK